MKKIIKIMLLCISAIYASGLSAQNIIKNGSFETGTPGKIPDQWLSANSGNAQANMLISDKSGKTGKKSLLITNKSRHKPHVFGSLYQFIHLRKGEKYQVSVWARGKNVRGLGFIFGNTWKTRRGLRNVIDEWKEFKFEFTAQKQDFLRGDLYPVRIIVESPCDECYIDKLEIAPAGARIIPPQKYQDNQVYLLKKTQWFDKAIMLPSDFQYFQLPDSTANYSKNKLPSPQDFSASFALAYCPEGIILTAKVTDDKIVIRNGADMWRGDSIQVVFDQSGNLPAGFDSHVLEFSLGLDKSGRGQAFCTQLGVLSPKQLKVNARKTKTGYIITALFKWPLLSQIKPESLFSFNLIFNENDGKGRSVAYLAPGIHQEKSCTQNTIVLFDTGKPSCHLICNTTPNANTVNTKTLIINYASQKPEKALLELTDSQNKTIHTTIDMPPITGKDNIIILNKAIPLAEIAPGKFRMQATVNQLKSQTTTNEKSNMANKLRKAIDAIRSTITQAEQQVASHYPNGQISRYIEVPIAEIKRQIGLLERDIVKGKNTKEKNFYLQRGVRILTDLQESVKIMNTTLAKMKKSGLPETWLYQSSPVKLQNGWFTADCINEKGKVKHSNIIFTGYGHFGQVVSDMPFFNKIAMDMVQIEIGPKFFLTPTGITRGYLNEYIFKALKRARENNISVCLLLSPHYTPGWFLKEHPELKRKSGFLNYEFNHPLSKAMIKRYLTCLITKLKNSEYAEAISSLCISNEPKHEDCSLDREFTRNEFKKYLGGKYHDISTFNSMSGNSFTSFDDLIARGENNTAFKYELHTFRRKTLADWHKWMANTIRDLWPEIPISVKIMAFSSITNFEHGVDIEQFSELSDINGNDNYTSSNNYSGSKYVAAWSGMSLSHDLQLSSKKTCILNSENHIIADGEKRNINYDYIYTSIFQQYLQGAGGIITWVWYDADFKNYQTKPALRGCIFRRPNDVIAQSYANLDANRVVDDIIAFVRAEPEVALLYSSTSYILNTSDYISCLRNTYEYLNFTGIKTGFLTEKQIQNNKFKNIKVLFLTDVKYIEQATWTQIKKFVSQGGILVSVGNSPTTDQFGKKLSGTINIKSLDSRLTGPSMQKKLNPIINKHVKLPVKLLYKDNNPATGIQWRYAKTPRGILINIVNYNSKTRKLMLKGKGSFYDLIADKPFNPKFKLKPLKPLLLKFMPQ